MNIRVLTVDDSQAFFEVRLRSLKDHPEAYWSSFEEESQRTLEDIQEMLRTKIPPEEFILGAFDDDKLVGMVGYFRNWKYKVGHRGNIWGVYVAGEHRGKGLAKTLMLQTIDIAQQNPQVEQIELSVVSVNQTAHQLYLKLGFEDWGIVKDAIRFKDIHYDEIHMVKYLK